MNKKHYLRSTRNLYYIDEKPQLRVYYSYTTPVALMIDGGNKQNRLKPEEFNELVKKHKPEPNFLKTVSTVSAMFGLMCQNDVKTKNKYQKRFFDKVQGINFPDDWESLSEEEKTKRLNGATKIGLEK
jgi:hypothetical protein